MFDFTNGRITLVISPVDMRSGFASLAGIARTYLSIDVYKGGHLVLFINRNRDICKLIWTVHNPRNRARGFRLSEHDFHQSCTA